MSNSIIPQNTTTSMKTKWAVSPAVHHCARRAGHFSLYFPAEIKLTKIRYAPETPAGNSLNQEIPV